MPNPVTRPNFYLVLIAIIGFVGLLAVAPLAGPQADRVRGAALAWLLVCGLIEIVRRWRSRRC